MENNPWDDQLRDLLGEYRSGEPTSPVGKPEAPLNENPESEIVSPEDQLEAWKRIEATLDASDHAFDETVRHRINNYGPAYDPHSWPVFLNRWASNRYLRTKLIIVKSVEMMMILLLLLTVVNMGRMGKLPFESEMMQDGSKPSQKESKGADQLTAPQQIQILPSPTQQKVNKDFTMLDQQNQNSNSFSKSSGKAKAVTASNSKDNTSPSFINQSLSRSTSSTSLLQHEIIPTVTLPLITPEGIDFDADNSIAAITPAYHDFTTTPIALVDLVVDYTSFESVPSPKFVTPVSRTYTEFGILVQADYNALRMPEDRLYSAGQQITFPSKGIMSPGFGAGFSVGIGHPIWALETGVVYSAKDFKPGRQLIVGGAFDNGSVEFEAMKLQMVSMPVQYRYRFDHTGRLKSYITAGGGFHVIAQSNIDVQIKYHFASLSFGENPNNDPALAETIQESRRIRDHILDGAPFRTKSFVSANAGLGLEYMISPHKAFFLQSIIQYQIPGLQFSNNNGKHLRSISLQAGVRGPLGK